MEVIENKDFVFDTDSLALVQALIARYPAGKQKSALLPILHMAQAEAGGWLSTKTMDYVASLLKIRPVEVYEVASFYTMFNLQPVGQCVIEVCRTGPCWLSGAGEIIAHLEQKLGIKAGETTPDGKFSLKTVECLAACGNAPVMQAGMNYYENLTPEKVDAFLDACRQENATTHQNPYK